VVAQVAISAVLLVGAVLLARTLYNLQRIDLGIRDAGVVAFEVDPGLQGYDRESTAALMEALSTAIGDEAGVESVAAVWSPPYDLLSVPYVLKRPDAEWNGPGSGLARSFQTTPGLFETLGIELVAGRAFGAGEIAAGEHIAILNETAARVLFPDVAPASLIGRSVERRGLSDASIRIIGVVRDARLERPALPSRPYIFVPWSQGIDVGRFTMYVRTGRSLESLSPLIREVSATIDATLPVHGLRAWRSEIRSLLSEQRLVASLALGLAGFGLLLAAIGLHGVLALAVTRRTREIGIRCALGARPRRLMGRVVRSALTTSLAGLLPGLLAAAWLSRVLESRLYGIGRLDPGTYILGSATLLFVVLVASWLPARRAMRVEPTIALRQN
jgi:predicted permease